MAFIVFDWVNPLSSWGKLNYLVNAGVMASFPFGLSFMLITLSFARRIKVHNFWDHLWVRKAYRFLRRKVNDFWNNRRSSEKIMLVFSIYVVLEIVNFILVYLHKLYGFWMFVVVQVIAFIVVYHWITDIQTIEDGIEKVTEGDYDFQCKLKRKHSLFKTLSNGINHISDGLKDAVETSLKNERMRTELITNVSHDLKTPLTSIINYVNLLKTEKMPTEEAKHYVEVLDKKAQRLRHLTEDLVEVTKANTGNIELVKMPLAFDELMRQAIGEFEDKFTERDLTIVVNYPETTVMVMADGRRMFRIIENVLQNVYKYALSGTRVYVDLVKVDEMVIFTLKNISAAPLNISADALMERFTRGDSSRTTEGSGLGLSIAKDLTKLQDGTFEILLDGDLFKVIITFPEYVKKEEV